MAHQEKFRQGDVVRISRDRRPNKVSSKRYIVGTDAVVAHVYRHAYGTVWYFVESHGDFFSVPEDVIEIVPNFVLVPAEVKDPEQPAANLDPMTPFRQKCLDKFSNGVGLCAFGFRGHSKAYGEEEYLENMGPCHAGMGYKQWGADEIYLDIKHQRNKIARVSQEKANNYDTFVDYILNKSPWSRAFITKDVKVGMEMGVSMNPHTPHDITVGAAVALRQGNEFSTMLKPFVEGLKFGMNPNCAFVYGMLIKGGNPSPLHGGHSVIASTMDYKDLVSFFETGYKDRNLRRRFLSSERMGEYTILTSVCHNAPDNLWERVKEMDGIDVKEGWDGSYRITDSVKFMTAFKKEWENAIQQ